MKGVCRGGGGVGVGVGVRGCERVLCKGVLRV